MTSTTATRTKIIIVGGGFAGVHAAQRLAGHRELDIMLISASPNFAYYPQLYHAATGGARSEASISLHELLGTKAINLVQDTIIKLDPDTKTLTGAGGATYRYDRLLLAMGSVTNYFGIQGLKEFSYDIKTIDGAEKFKKHLHDELLDKIPDINYVVVGGGPTGVELAAALGDYMRRITRLHGIGKPQYKLELVEASPRILPRSPEAVSARVQRRLEQLGVTVMTGAVVEAETAETLKLKGQDISSRTVVWTAGVSNNPFFKDHAALFTLAKNGKVEVDEHLQGRPDVYVLGDNAATQFSGLAETAVSDAGYVAADLLLSLSGQPRPAYRAKTPFSVIPVGERWAVAQRGSLIIYGYIGYILRRLGDLIGYADIESWPQAVKIWLRDLQREDDCPICQSQA